MSTRPDIVRELDAPRDYHIGRTLSGLRMGPYDPTIELSSDRARLACRTPGGPASVAVRQSGPCLHLEAWGPGAPWLTERAEGLLGLQDRPQEFVPSDAIVSRLSRRFKGTHLPRLPQVLQRTIQIVLLQLVTSQDGYRAWRRLVHGLGEEAPGTGGLLLSPSPERLAATPDYALSQFGILPRQARTLLCLAREAQRLERAAQEGSEALSRRLAAIPGVGPWTIQYVLGSALGEPDAVLEGDYNLPRTVGWVLAGEERTSEERMLELLEPFRGHRFRVIRLLWMNGVHAPRRGPRLPRRDL